MIDLEFRNQVTQLTEAIVDKKLSRRQFVGAAAGGVAALGAGTILAPNLTGATASSSPSLLAKAPASPAARVPKMAGPVPVPSSWDGVADVIVVGFGGAGGAAALMASAGGSKVLVLEKLAAPGGSSAMAHGSFAAAGTTYEAALGIVDTPGKMFDFWMKTGMGMNDPELVMAFCENGAAAWLWLANTLDSQIGVTDPLKVWGQSSFTGSPYVVASDVVPRMPFFLGYSAAGYPNGGAGTFKGVYSAVNKDPNIQVMLNTPGVGLITNNGEVVGVEALVNDSLKYFEAKRAVVLTTGSFARNDEIAHELSQFVYYGVKGDSLGDTGDGIIMGQQVGAALQGPFAAMSHPRAVSGLAISTNTSIFVNNSGQRFVNEDTQYVPTSQLSGPYIPNSWGSYYAGFQIFSQQKMQAWAIFDSAGKGTNSIAPPVVTANTVPDLATALGMSPAALTNTISLWNTNATNNTDPLYGRCAYFFQLSTPPYYACPLNWTVDDAWGGLKINGNTQVLDSFGTPIPRLYAAGATTGGIIGPFYNESGGAHGQAYTMGWIAGQKAAAMIPWE
jgi:succinate dehydrogenase/fumarate reductase flavoprotein subunit